MISPADIRPELLVYVGVSDAHAARVIGIPYTRDGRPYVQVRYYRTNKTDDVPLSVVRAMSQREQDEVLSRGSRKQKPWRKRLAELNARPPRKSRAVRVTLDDVAAEFGASADELQAAMRRQGMGRK